MIVNFKHLGLKRFYERGDAKHIAPDHRRKVSAILTTLDNAAVIEDMNLATFHLHPLIGDQQSRWSVTVRANWRITFLFEGGNAHDVDYEDYH